jgi:sulfoacetaldehyde dehydrogenase
MRTIELRKPITEEQQQELSDVLDRASKALAIIETYDQARVDRLCQAVAWSVANKRAFTRLVDMGIAESGLGDAVSRMGKRMKIRGVLRDALRQRSVGIIEELPEKGIVKYGKPAGIVACIVPTTNPDLTPAGNAIYGIKARDVVIFSPHPRSKKTSYETVRLMREALQREGAPADILQCLTKVNIPMSQALMARADLIIATGGQPMVRAAHSSGTPAYGVGAGNSTMIIDETADIQEAALNTRLSKTSDFGSGCSADGNLIIEASIFDKLLAQLQLEGGYLANDEEKAALRAVMWDEEAHRLPDTVAIAPQQLARAAGFSIPADRKFIIVHGDGIGKDHVYSSEKLTTLLAVYKYKGFDQALQLMRAIYEVGGKGHSCGIYSFSREHIHALALAAPVSRIMVRQPQSKANAGAFNNGMPMTSSLGCGTWGGNIVSENVHLKHYMNTTWVSVPIKEDKPSDEELFGSFYDPVLEAEVETATT